jgi:putative DNA primase/helicase
MPQILGWLIRGCLMWQKDGLNEPDTLKEAHRDYRSEMDIVQRWVNENCMLVDDMSTSSSELFENFSEYVKANKEFQLSHTMFGRNMSKKFKKGRIAGVTAYKGIVISKPTDEYKMSKEEYEDV